MTRRFKGLLIGLALVTAAVAAFGIGVSRDATCPLNPPPSSGSVSMKAIVHRCYGAPDVLRLEQIDVPTITADQVLIRVRAAAVNPLDWHYTRGTPYIMRLGTGFGAPKEPRVGVDFAGVVEAVGKNVTRFAPGDEVFGGKTGALAEYVVMGQDGDLARKPARLTFEQAAAIPIAGITALQGLRDHGKLQRGQKVLINGASGGVGTFAVQIAKSLGAEVTGVCSSRNVEMVRSLGADHVIDYTKEDFAENGQRYDLILDNVGNRSLSDLRRVLTPQGRAILVGGGGPNDGNWIGPMINPIKAMLLSPFVSQTLTMFLADLNPADLTALADMMQAGTVTPVVDRQYQLSEAAVALQYLEEGRARGKVVITVP